MILMLDLTVNVFLKKVIHEISSTDFGKLIKIRGFTSRIHDVKPMATVMAF